MMSLPFPAGMLVMLSITVFTEIDVSFSKFQPHHMWSTCGQYKTWTADCGLGIKYGLGIKRGLENTDWV